MWSPTVTVLGILASAALAGYIQRFGDRRAREHAHRQEVTRAVAELLEAIVRHREVHWLAVESRRADVGETEERMPCASAGAAGVFLCCTCPRTDGRVILTPPRTSSARSAPMAAAGQRAGVTVEGNVRAGVECLRERAYSPVSMLRPQRILSATQSVTYRQR